MMNVDAEKLGQLSQFGREMSHPDRTMMCRARRRPSVHEPFCTEGKPVAAIRIANVQHRTRHRFPFRHQQGKFSVPVLHDGEERDRTVPDSHLNRKSFSHFAVIDLQRHQPHTALRNRKMGRAIVPEENNVVLEIDQ